MNRPWQFWLVYVSCVTMIVMAMSWLTVKALELDHAEVAARSEAQLEQLIGRALWRMDVKLVPLLAQEATRPYFVYRPSYAPPGAVSGATEVLSPLLTDRPEFVLLNFQCGPNAQWECPQAVPVEQAAALAEAVPADELEIYRLRFEELKTEIEYERLMERLPNEWLPSTAPLPRHQPPTAAAQLEKQSVQILQNTLSNSRPQSGGRPFDRDGSPSMPDRLTQASEIGGAPQMRRSDAELVGELVKRNEAVQTYAQNVLVAERKGAPSSNFAREGVSQTLWVADRLLLARRAELQGQVVIQGCWLDWPAMKAMLLKEIADLLPEADLTPASEENIVEPGRMLASIPVQLVAPRFVGEPLGWRAIRVSLWTAWFCLFIAVVALAMLCQGLLSLNERRDAFVSSVTHELRTPLTTFRMYAEMLAEDMVSNPGQRRHYLHTLRNEADRLFHLVENVLSYAQLERGREPPHREWTTVGEVMDRIQGRLEDRTRQAGLQLVVEGSRTARDTALRTDPAAIEQILFNLVDNACKYAHPRQDKRIHLEISVAERHVCWRVRDHGRGVSDHDARRLFRPFSKSAAQAAASAPGVGLGLALSRRLTQALGGSLTYQSQAEGGAAFLLRIPLPPPSDA